MAKRTWQKKLLRIFLKTLGVLFLLVIVIVLLIQTPFVQNIVRKKAVGYLQEKLHTKVAIGKIYIGFPKDIVLKDIYIEDLQKDTLLWGGEISANISMFKLLHNELEVNEVRLANMTAKIKRQLPDTTFNFQFIIDAFASKDTKTPEKKDTSSMKMAIKSLILDKVRFVYKDIVTGNDLESYVGHFDTKIDHFDLNRLQFDIPTVRLQGFRAIFIQNSPLQTPAATIKQAKPETDTTNMQFGLHAIELADIAVTFQSNTSGFFTSFAAATLNTSVREFSIDKQTVDINKLQLERSTIIARMDKQQARPPVSNTKAGKDTSSEDSGGWRIIASQAILDNILLQYDDNNKPATRQGIDYAHIKASDFSLSADNLLYTKDSIAGTITKGSFKEQSGFELRRMQTAFLYTNNEAFLKDMLIETPGTSIRRSISIQYPSIDAMAKNPELIRLDADISNSRILLKDVLSFVPSLRSQALFENPQQTLLINTSMRGSLANLDIGTLQFTGFRDTKVDVSGNIQHVTDSKRIHANLNIKNLTSSKRDLETLLPAGTLPSNITIPDRFAVTGKLNGGVNKINTNLTFTSNLGSATIIATAQQFSDKLRAVYDATIDVRNLDLGTILQNKENFGAVTARFYAKGKGYDPQYANAVFNGVVKSATIKKYTYNDFRVQGTIANQQAKVTASIHDRNIALSLDASGNFATKYPSAQLTLNIDSIHTFPLHLTTDTIVYKGSIVADFPSTNPDSLKGSLFTSTTYFAKNARVLPFDSIRLTAGQSDSGQFIRLDSRPMVVNMTGTYKLTQMGAVFAQMVEPYFSTQDDSSKQVTEPYNFTVTASVIEDSLLKVFIPTLKKMDSVTLRGNFSSDKGPTATLKAPLIIIGENQVNNLQLEAVGNSTSLDINTSFNHLQVGTGIEINKTSLNATLANNKIDFTLASLDKSGKDKYKLAGLFEQPTKGEYAFSLKQGNILLNYDDWTVSSDNRILIRKDDINVTNFVLSRSGQQLSIASTSTAVNAPVDVNFSNFKIGTLTGFIKPDSTLAAGTLHGKATLNDLMKQPTFTSDLTINTLVINSDTVGNIMKIPGSARDQDSFRCIRSSVACY